MQLLHFGRLSFKSEKGFSTLINLIAGLVIAVGLGVVIYLVQQRTHILPFAQQTTGGNAQCQAPAQPTNVTINYPDCQ